MGRVLKAAGYSAAGLAAAFRHEAAFRQELLLCLVLVPLALWLPVPAFERLALLGTMVLVLIVELLNSAIEALADRISADHDPLLGRAKDIGSAAVMLALLLCGATWLVVAWPVVAARLG